MASISDEVTGEKYISDIQEAINMKDYKTLSETTTKMTKFLFSNEDLIYSHLNDKFESAGLLEKLFNCMENLNEQSKRDILRLLNLFLKTNKTLRSQASRSHLIMQFLFKSLSSREKWGRIDKIKYHVNLSSYLLQDRECQENTELIRRIVRQILEELKSNEDYQKRITYMIFYSSAEINAKSGNNDLDLNDGNHDGINDGIMNKEICGRFVELIRDYNGDFKMFYDNEENEQSRFLKYNLKAEYSFDQICHCISYYAKTSKKAREDLYQSGLYELISQSCMIKSFPEVFMLPLLDILEIPSFDSTLRTRFSQEHSLIVERLKNIRSHSSNLVRSNVERLLDKYRDCQSLKTTYVSSQFPLTNDNLITLPNTEQRLVHNGTKDWGCLDVDQWLSEHNLQVCRKPFASMTGRGFNQLKFLMKEKDGKFKLIDLLTSKLNIDFISVLELLGALESISTD